MSGDDARRLPPGAHGIPPDVIARNQRERLIAAIAEACAERGFADLTLSDIVGRAGVSNVTFYEQFDDKRACLLAAHEELFGRLSEEVEAACGHEREWAAKVRRGVHVALELLAADPPSARLLTVEVMAAGPEGMERQAAAIEALAARLRGGHEPGGDPPNPDADWVLVAGIVMLIGKRVMAGEASGLPQLEEELVAMLTALC
jgi:AcrR family transcriptional regulator